MRFITLLDRLKFTGLNREVDASEAISSMIPNWRATAVGTAASDDDLGFDPFLESNKALTDMLENETLPTSPMPTVFRSPFMRPTPPPPGVPLPAHMTANVSSNSTLFSDGIISSIVPPMLPVVSSSSSSPLPPPPPGLSGLPQFPNTSNTNPQGNQHPPLNYSISSLM